MAFLRNNPFFKLLFPLIAGILFQFYLPVSRPTILIILGLSGLLFLIVARMRFRYYTKYRQGIIIAIFIFSWGITITAAKSTNNKIISDESIELIGELTQIPQHTKNGFKCEVHVEAQKTENFWKETDFKLLVFFKKDSSVASLKAGQKIVFNTQLNETKSNQNPFGFDYGSYLKLKQIGYTSFVGNNDWELLDNKVSGIKNKALNFRQSLLSVYSENGITGDHLAVLSALTLGYKNQLDAKLKSAYSAAGAMHVLAVSGLHVGILYWILNWILSLSGWLKKFIRFRFLLVFAGIWVYAFITGLSPSVLRATVMISFLMGGKLLNRNISIYNSLAASAFILLSLNPLLLFNLGFKLSYFALTGIVFFQPKISRLFYVKFLPLRWAWELTAVSIAAQLATFPLTIKHFHQFPIYFWFSNLGVSLMAFIIFTMAIFLLIISPWHIVAGFIGKVTDMLLMVNQHFIDFINNLPGALVNDLGFSGMQILLIYGIIFFMSFWLVSKRYYPLLISLMLIMSMGLGNVLKQKVRANQSALCVYQVTRGTGLQFVNNDQSNWMFSEQTDQKVRSSMMQDGNLYWNTRKCCSLVFDRISDTTIQERDWFYKNGFWSFHDIKGLLIHTNSEIPGIPVDTLCFDYLIVTGNPSFNLSDIPQKIKFKNIIIDGSVPFWKIDKFRRETSQTASFATAEQGAYIKVNN